MVEGAHGYVLWCTQVHVHHTGMCCVHMNMCCGAPRYVLGDDWPMTLVAKGVLQVVIQSSSGCLWVGLFWTFEK